MMTPRRLASEHEDRGRLCGRALVAVLGTLLIALCSPAAVAQPTDGPPLPDNALQGRSLFEGKHCNLCHGIGNTGPGIGPSLGEGRFSGSFLELGAALWNHVPGMGVTIDVSGLAWPELSEKETIELVAFLYFIDYLGRPGVAAAGQSVFAGECGACHSVGGGEAAVGPDLADLRRFASPLFVAQEIWNHGPSMFESMREMSVSPPVFEEGDLADLSAFIRQRAEPGPQERMLLAPGNPNRGRELFAGKGCSTCHGEDARGGQGGPNLAESDLHRSAEAIAGTMWNHALAMSETMQERGVGWPELANSDLADLVAFLYFLPFSDPLGDPAQGAEVFRDRSCAQCHPVEEQGDGPVANQGPALAGGIATTSPAALVAKMWNHAPIMRDAILGEGHPWPELTGEELRNLHAYFASLPGKP